MSVPAKGDFLKVQGNKQYLPVPARVQWFRGDHPLWTIGTSVVELNWAEGYAVMRAEVLDETGRLIASGMKTETRKGFGDFVEKAETGAVGRALARVGYGTEDALDLEGDRFADAPIQQPERAQPNVRQADSRSGGATPVQPAPASPQYRRAELAELMHEKHLDNDAVLRYAAVVGIPEDERPMTDASMDKLINAVRGHGTDAVIEPDAGVPTSSVESSEPEGGPLPSGAPPKPGTDEYRALAVTEKANARAYWATHSEPEQETLAELMGAPA